MHTQDLQVVHSECALGVVLCANIHFAVPIFLVPACVHILGQEQLRSPNPRILSLARSVCVLIYLYIRVQLYRCSGDAW